MTKEERDAVQARCISIDNIIISIERELRMLRTHLDILTKVCKTENSSEKPNNCEAQTERGKLINAVVKLDMSREDKFKVIELLERHCEKCKHHLFTDIDGYYCEHETYGQPCEYEPKDEPTISKMEQVDKDINVRSKERSE